AATRSVRDGKLADAARELDVAASELEARTGAAGLSAAAGMRRLPHRLAAEDPRWRASTTSFARGASWCRAAEPRLDEIENGRPDAAVMQALLAWALGEWERAFVAGPEDEQARRAAARLDALYMAVLGVSRGLERREALMKRFPLDD